MRGWTLASLIVWSCAAMPPVMAADPVAASEQARLWDREVRLQVQQLKQTVVAGIEASSQVAILETVRNRADLDPVRRDAVFYGYIQALREWPAAAIPQAALDWLAEYPAQAMRGHDESGSAQVPLFDVATAARGLRNEKVHRLAGDALLAAGANSYPDLLTDYVAADDAAFRSGMERAVVALSPPQLTALSAAVAARSDLDDSPLAANILLARHDGRRLLALMAEVRPALAVEILRSAPSQLAAMDVLALTRAALLHADAGVRGVAMAQANTLIANQPDLRADWLRQLHALLTDPELGAAAALHLARELPAEALHDLATASDAVLAQRLQLIQRLRNDLPALNDDAELPP